MPKLTRIFKGRVLAVHRLEDGRCIMGRAIESNICIDSLAVAPQQLELIITGECCEIKNLDSNYPVYINNRPIQTAQLRHGDELHVGKHCFIFSQDGVAIGVHVDGDVINKKPQSAMKTVNENKESTKKIIAYLQIQSGEHLGRVIALKRDLIYLGKIGSNRAMITRRADSYYLSYLEGKKVTVGGLPVGTESILLRDGNLIQIGATRFQFYYSVSE